MNKYYEDVEAYYEDQKIKQQEIEEIYEEEKNKENNFIHEFSYYYEGPEEYNKDMIMKEAELNQALSEEMDRKRYKRVVFENQNKDEGNNFMSFQKNQLKNDHFFSEEGEKK